MVRLGFLKVLLLIDRFKSCLPKRLYLVSPGAESTQETMQYLPAKDYDLPQLDLLTFLFGASIIQIS